MEVIQVELQAGPAAPAAVDAEPAAESALLRCLSQLNFQLNDVFAVHLLPKLVEQGSAGAVRLTCSQLRALLQPSIQHLNLTKQLEDEDNPLHSLKVARQLTAAFPNCTHLKFAWSSSSLVNVYRNISPLLAGLPHLQTVGIILDGDSTAGDLDPVMCQLHMHATCLRSLGLKLSTDYTDDAAWVSVGKMVILTNLQLHFGRKVTHPCTQQNLQLLTGLSNLQALDIYAPGTAESAVEQEGEGLQLAVQEFPGRLTALTKLQLSLESCIDLSSVSGCVSLQDLQVRAVTAGRRRQSTAGWDPQEWAALAQLTQLTRLHIDVNVADSEGHDGFFDVLQGLKDLRIVGAWVWDNSRYLPLIQGLAHLTHVCGAWSLAVGGLDVSSVKCPQVKELHETCGEIPFAAFPNLAGVSFYEVTEDHVMSLSCCCSALEWIEMPDQPNFTGDDATRALAYRSLATFKHLTHLEVPSCDAEDFAVFVSAAAAAGEAAPKLHYLHVHGPVQVTELMQLPQLVSVCGVRELSVVVDIDSKVVFPPPLDDASALRAVGLWLVGLAVVPKVSLKGRLDEHRSLIEAAKLWATQRGLPLPASLRVSVAPDD